MLERMKFRDGIMFRTVPLAATEQEGNLRLIASASCGEFVTVAIVPPREQKLLKCSQKRVKWAPGDVAGDFSISGPNLFARDTAIQYSSQHLPWPPRCGGPWRARNLVMIYDI